MKDLVSQQCKPCEGGVCPFDESDSFKHLEQLPGWHLDNDKTGIVLRFKFKDFVTTMSFISAMAKIAEKQGHHPDFSAGYNYCEVSYTTHAIGGLSENDFICAAKIDLLLNSAL